MNTARLLKINELEEAITQNSCILKLLECYCEYNDSQFEPSTVLLAVEFLKERNEKSRVILEELSME